MSVVTTKYHEMLIRSLKHVVAALTELIATLEKETSKQ